MSRRPSRSTSLALALVALACISAPLHAQFGGGGGRGGGGRRGEGGAARDSAAGRPRRDPAAINTVDVIMERRADLGLTGEQIGRISAAKTRRDAAVDTLSARALALRLPSDPNIWTTMSDSERVAMRDRVRERAAALRAQRNAEATARDEALAALTPEQRDRATRMEEAMRKGALAAERLGGAARANDPGMVGAGGMPGGRNGTP